MYIYHSIPLYTTLGYVRAQADRAYANIVEDSIVNDKRVLSVGYGYASENIGNIEVTHQTTYADVHGMVQPLIKTYLANNHQHLVEDLLHHYSLMDPENQVVDEVDAKVVYMYMIMYSICIFIYTSIFTIDRVYKLFSSVIMVYFIYFLQCNVVSYSMG